MTQQAYTGAQVRRGLIHFLSGKSITAIVGLLLLLVLVRVLNRADYGTYIALTAMLEIIQLSSNFGSLPAAFRYIPELRIGQHVHELSKLTNQLLTFRVATLVLATACLYCFAGELALWLKMPSIELSIKLYSLVIVTEGLARFIDVVFDSLLLQGYAQISILIRNGLRLSIATLFLLWPSTQASPLTIDHWIFIEAGTSGLGAAVALFLLQRHLGQLKNDQPQKCKTGNEIPFKRMRAFALPTFWAQILSLLQGPDAAKLLITKVASAAQTGAFGFAAALNAMLQRNLPVFLLIGMVRPIFVAAKSGGKSPQELVAMGGLLFKINVFFLCPFIAILLVSGDQVANILSGGKFPESGKYLTLLALLLVCQTLHSVLGLLALVAEESRATLHGTIAGLIGLGLGLALTPLMGPIAICGGLILSELFWCIVMNRALSRHNLAFVIKTASLFKMAIAACIGAFVMLWLQRILPAHWPSLLSLTLISLACGLSFLAFAWLLRPFEAHERALINKALPRPLFVW